MLHVPTEDDVVQIELAMSPPLPVQAWARKPKSCCSETLLLYAEVLAEQVDAASVLVGSEIAAE